MLTTRRSVRELVEAAVPVGRVSGCSSCAHAKVQGRLERELVNEDLGMPWPAIVVGAVAAGGVYYLVSRRER